MTDVLRQPSCSEVVAGHGTLDSAAAGTTQAGDATSMAPNESLLRIRDVQAVRIDVGTYKGAKGNFAKIEEDLQNSFRVNKIAENFTITCMRPASEDCVEVAFENDEEANKGKVHTRWLS